MTNTIRIETETAKYYLNLEVYFGLLCQKIGIDPDAYLQEQQSITRAIDISKRGIYREELYERWQEAVGKKPYQPRKRSGRRLPSGNWRPNSNNPSGQNAPQF